MCQTKVVQKIKTQVLYSITFTLENGAIYEIMWGKIVQQDRPQMTIWHIHIACWIPKATLTLVYLLFIHCNNGCTNAPPCYVLRTLRVFFTLRREKDFSILQSTEIGFGAHPASHSMCTWDPLPRSTAAMAWSWPHLRSVPRSRMGGSIPPHSICLNGVHKDIIG